MQLALRPPSRRLHPLVRPMSRGFGDFEIPGVPGMQPGCDPKDTACVNAMLVAQAARLPECKLHPEICYGGSEYDKPDAGYAARQAFNASLPKPVNPYVDVMSAYRDSSGTTHHLDASGKELFRTLSDGRVEQGSESAVTAPAVSTQPATTSAAVTKGAPTPDVLPSDSGDFFSRTIVVGGSNIPMLAILAAAGVALYLFTRNK